MSACWAGSGPPPTRSPRSGLRSPRTPARPSALTESSARCPRAGGGTGRTGKRAREERRRTPKPGRTPPVANFQSLGAQNRPACILPHSHFRKLSRKPGGLTALWSSCVGTERRAFWLSAAPGGCLCCCWGLWTSLGMPYLYVTQAFCLASFGHQLARLRVRWPIADLSWAQEGA